jgi:hypothetical protein
VNHAVCTCRCWGGSSVLLSPRCRFVVLVHKGPCELGTGVCIDCGERWESSGLAGVLCGVEFGREAREIQSPPCGGWQHAVTGMAGDMGTPQTPLSRLSFFAPPPRPSAPLALGPWLVGVYFLAGGPAAAGWHGWGPDRHGRTSSCMHCSSCPLDLTSCIEYPRAFTMPDRHRASCRAFSSLFFGGGGLLAHIKGTRTAATSTPLGPRIRL